MKSIVSLLLCSTVLVSGVPLSSSAESNLNPITSWSSRILGGQDAKRHQIPYQVAFKTELGYFFCGGILISKDFVLSHSYCANPEITIMAYMGMVNLDQNDTDVQIRKVVKSIFHPKNLRGLGYYKVILFQLESPVSFTIAVQPVQLASGKECEALGEATISGWGAVEGGFSTNELKFLKLPVLDILECDYRSSRIKRFCCPKPLWPTQLCMGGSGSQLQVGVDIGSPVYRESTKKVIGVSSAGYHYRTIHDQPFAPTNFENVCKVRDWITEEVNL